MPLLVSLLLVALADPPPAPPKEVDYEAELNDKLGKGVTPETNANVPLWRAFGPRPEGGSGMPAGFYQRLGIAEPPADGTYFVDFGRFARERLKVDPDDMQAVFDEQDAARKRPWTAADHPRIAAWLTANEGPLALAVEASRRPHYYNPLVSRRDKDGKPGTLIGVLLPGVQKVREVAAALTCRAMLRVGEGKAGEAWADVLAVHRLGRLVGRGGTLIEGLVGYALVSIGADAAVLYLEHAPPTAEQARAKLTELQAIPVPPVADNIDLGERYFYLDSLRLVRAGNGDFAGMLGEGKPGKVPSEEAKKRLAAIDWQPAVDDAKRWYDRMVAAARLPSRAERVKALEAIEADIKKLRAAGPPGNIVERAFGLPPAGKDAGRQIGNVLIGLVMPALMKVTEAHDRALQTDRNLQLAFALAAYRADKGAYPKALAGLAPAYLTAVPDDLFSGKPLAYRPAAGGYLLYSVGVNGKDDGGRTYGEGLDEGLPPADDLRVRMPRGK